MIVVWTVYLVGVAVVTVDSEGDEAVVVGVLGLVVLGVDVLVVMQGAVVEAVVVVMGVGLVVVK
mgnify:CR=1 FL=1